MKIFCIIILQISTYSSQLNTIISQYLGNSSAENTNVSISIRKISDEKEIFSYQPKMALPPASTLKLLTTGTALDTLGEDFRFKTIVKTRGQINNGILDGNIIIVPNGDPSFGSKRLGLNSINEIVETLKLTKIKQINGRILIEENRKYQIPNDWLLGDLGNYYGAFPKDFNYNENFYTVYFNGGDKVGDSVSIKKVSPSSVTWKIKNDVRTAEKGTGDQVNILNLAPYNEIVMSGTVPLKSSNFEVKGSIPNINNVFVDLLIAECSKNEIEVSNEVQTLDNPTDTLIILHSPKLSTIAEHCNFRSINFFADGLSNFLVSNLSDSAQDYNIFLKNYWSKKGLNLNNFSFLDGSGLSPMNTFSPQTMTSFLSKMALSKSFDSFLASIPKVGKSGTVATLDPSGITRGRIYAKSGSISGTRNYAGYFFSEKNDIYSFCIYLNGLNDAVQLLSRQFLQNLLFKMIDLNQ
ncbi:D-alanyl-D-alanine carboxypeptidase/D-alanyl-D-alanine-endopeptidase [Lacihabitans sp. CCS-44]|uniref:D-alanyl-D-alanine carboxypeptidase/D-alanyl-D-alanine endopeptidase n=1 Tax=Lacihabitans sp. CCS-44 TaxID=2487331 RepID=UPI0020CD3BC1|nr:D-alanyl-D-alanine carboxypeptidase/D-alanyl-D-alanine-endopeptidase [Lacihabitans sp. CCS-44]MCP9757131.1 D-alanyl-D-alanine carboxypeptidase/D-alanyl-D-alanine-endopeptidase [Lacihabitans sp. CCS-44]